MRLRTASMRSIDGLADEELLPLARRDPEALAVFYRRHVGSIVGFFVRRTACQESAADLTTETFAQIYHDQLVHLRAAKFVACWRATIPAR
jgi:DNA-directed RNA polymerase specialized sigma24 family protein